MVKNNLQDVAHSLQKLGGQLNSRSITLDLYGGRDTSLQKLKALASEPRLRILEHLSYPTSLSNLTEIAEALDMNLATVTMHVNILDEAGLIVCEHKPGERGTQRVCGCFFDWVNIQMKPNLKTDTAQLLELTMPIGNYFDFQITPTCGLFSEHKQIGIYDDPYSFYESERTQAQLLWFTSGYVEYRYPHHLGESTQLDRLSLSLELCSEAPGIHQDWPSDITVWINGIDIGSWTSPADFGGSRGKLTPAWVPTNTTQHGILKTWLVNRHESQVDGQKVSDVTVDQLNLHAAPFISVQIGVKEDAVNVGGINIFGAKFGNHPQDIILRLWHHSPVTRV